MKRTPNMLLVCKIDVTESEKEEAHALEMIQDICCFQAWMPKQLGKVIVIKTYVEIVLFPLVRYKRFHVLLCTCYSTLQKLDNIPQHVFKVWDC